MLVDLLQQDPLVALLLHPYEVSLQLVPVQLERQCSSAKKVSAWKKAS